MSKSANVLSVQTLKDFKLAMINFAEEGRNSLSSVDMELRRMRDWLERDQLGYWQSQIKRRLQDVAQARADLHKRKISQQGSDSVSDAEQKEALREATRKLRIAEEKLAQVKRLVPVLHHAIDEYHSHSQPLGDHLAGGFEKSVFTLQKMINSLEEYLALSAPTAPRLGSLTETGASSTGSSASAGSSAVGSPVDDAAATESRNGTGSAANPLANADTAVPGEEPVTAGRTS